MEIINKTIPRGWQRLALSDVSVKLKTGGTPTSNNRDFYNGSIPFVKIDDMTTSGHYILKTKTHINEDALKNSSAWIVPAGSILYSIYATVGEVAINKVDLATNQAIVGIIPDDNKVNRNFLYYYLIYIKLSLSRFFKETTQKNLTTEIVKKLEVLVPPLNEQKKIAEILSTVDEEIQKTDEIIAMTEKLKRGLMTKIFKSQKGWETTTVKDIGEIITGNTPKTAKKENYGSDFIWISPRDIVGQKYISKSTKMLSAEGFNQTRKLPPGSVLIVCIGSTIGKVGIATKELSTNQQINSIIVNNKNDNEFIYYVLLFNKAKILKKTTTQAVPIINKSTFSNISIAIPASKKEQKTIAAVLSSLDEKIAINQKLKTKLIFLKKGLMQDLLSGKVRTI